MNSRIAKYAVAAAVLAAAILGMSYLKVSPDGATLAWADVLVNMEAAQTVQFTIDRQLKYEPDAFTWTQGTTWIKEPYRRFEGTDGWRYGEGPTHEETSVTIMDVSQNNRFIRFKHAAKLAHYAPDHGGHDALQTYAGLTQDFRDGTEEPLGEVTLADQSMVGFKLVRDKYTITVWVDPETSLPVRIERVALEGLDATILSDIRFDEVLDDTLFDMTPPEDYAVVNMGTEEFTIPFELTEAHLTKALLVEATSRGGTFPTLFRGGRRDQEARAKFFAEEKIKTSPAPEDAGTALLGSEFIKRLPENSNWTYVGEDVRLGDATRAVAWYKPAGQDTYRVIYGDLSVHEMALADLPPVPWEGQ